MLSIRAAAPCVGVLLAMAASVSGCGGGSDADLTTAAEGGAGGDSGGSGAAGAPAKGGSGGVAGAAGAGGKLDAGPDTSDAEAGADAALDSTESGSTDSSAEAAADAAVDGPVKCTTSDDCPTPSELCHVPLCSSGNCTSAPAPEGTEVPTSAQKTGDCKKVTCGVGGAVTAIADTGDLPADDGNPCTDATCSGPNPAHVDSAAGTVCVPSIDPNATSGFCNGSGICGVCNPGSSDCDGMTPRSCDSTGAWAPGTACPYVCSGSGQCTGVCTPGSSSCEGKQPLICSMAGDWGANGSPCQFVCASGACNGQCEPGSIQCAGATPETCDLAGNWVAGAACPFVCSGAGECSGVCAPGSLDCQGNQPRLCDNTGQWVANGSSCPNICTAGQCAGSCPPGSVQCNGNTPQSCDSSGAWADSTPCTYVCSKGTCIGVCTPGDSRCSGSNVESCDANGQWVSTAACPYVCSDAACAGVCLPSSTRCMGKLLQTCNDAGTWQNTTQCEHVCSSGACTGVCNPGETQCNGNGVQTCDQNGQWQVSSTCPYVCINAGCAGVCTPGASRCNGLETQQCDVSGQWKTVSTCPYTCSAGSCTGTCIPGSVQCAGTNVQNCSGQGEWETTTTCPFVCTGEGECTGVCTPGVQKCEANTPKTCDGTGQWAGSAACTNQTCLSGTCQGVCVAGSLHCSGNTPQTCSAAGQWVSGAACVNQACEAGTCQGVCTPGAKDCSGKVPRVCGLDGQWQSGSACTHICEAGACVGVCTPGTRQCSGVVPQLCDSSGQWQNQTACTGTTPYCDAATATCVSCPSWSTVRFADFAEGTLDGLTTCKGCSGMGCPVPDSGALRMPGDWNLVCYPGLTTSDTGPVRISFDVQQENSTYSVGFDDFAYYLKMNKSGIGCYDGQYSSTTLSKALTTLVGHWDIYRYPGNVFEFFVNGVSQVKHVCALPHLSTMAIDYHSNGVAVRANTLVDNFKVEKCAASCTPGSKQCNGLTPQTCNDTGVWVNGTPCSEQCIGGECVAATACKALHAAQPSALSGNYTLDPDGSGALQALSLYCDMTFDGGGWTLYYSATSTAACTMEGPVAPGSAAYVAPAVAKALAAAATQVHIRTRNQAATRSATSVPNAKPIVNLRGLGLLNQSGSVSDWTGPNATSQYLNAVCSTDGAVYPDSFWACGNTTGLHIMTSAINGGACQANWNFSGAQENMEIYLR